MNDKDEANIEKATKCHICENTYTKKDICVRDPCHVTGNYRRSANQDCNLKLRINAKEIKIPVIFLNLRGYDSHFNMQEIVAIAKIYTSFNKRGEEQQMDFNVIPNNMKKYIAFMLGKHLVYLDSFEFMSASLEKLMTMLLNILWRYSKMNNLKSMKQKGVYPYGYMSSVDNKFNDTTIKPTIKR